MKWTLDMLRADSWFAPSQWETALLCNDVSHWLGPNLESALMLIFVVVFQVKCVVVGYDKYFNYTKLARATSYITQPGGCHFIGTNIDSGLPMGDGRVMPGIYYHMDPAWLSLTMMTSSNGSIFHVTGPLCGEFTGYRVIPSTKASNPELWCFFLICAWTNSWANNGDAGDLRCHCAHCDVLVMTIEWKFDN